MYCWQSQSLWRKWHFWPQVNWMHSIPILISSCKTSIYFSSVYCLPELFTALGRPNIWSSPCRVPSAVCRVPCVCFKQSQLILLLTLCACWALADRPTASLFIITCISLSVISQYDEHCYSEIGITVFMVLPCWTSSKGCPLQPKTLLAMETSERWHTSCICLWIKARGWG